MNERIIQLGLDLQSQEIVSHDVTPPGFTGFVYYPKLESPVSPTLGRFVREAVAKTCVDSPSEVFSYLQSHVFTPWEDFDQEELWILMLNTKNVITHEAMIYRGSPNTMYTWVPDLFREAIRLNCISLIVSHNHPSGNPEPSEGDITTTRQIVEAAKVLQMNIYDHIIVGRDRFVSLQEHGIAMR